MKNLGSLHSFATARVAAVALLFGTWIVAPTPAHAQAWCVTARGTANCAAPPCNYSVYETDTYSGGNLVSVMCTYIPD